MIVKTGSSTDEQPTRGAPPRRPPGDPPPYPRDAGRAWPRTWSRPRRPRRGHLGGGPGRDRRPAGPDRGRGRAGAADHGRRDRDDRDVAGWWREGGVVPDRDGAR